MHVYVGSQMIQKFIRGTNCMKFLKNRLSTGTVKSLDYLATLLCRKTRELVRLRCLKACLFNNCFPQQYYKPLRKQKLPTSHRILRRLPKSYIEKSNDTG